MDSDRVGNSGVMDLTRNIMIMSIIALMFVLVFAFLLYFFTNNRRRQQVMQDTNDPVVEQQRGLDASFLKTIRVIVFDPKDFKEGLECAVCLADLEEGEEARILPKCDHAFHVECIDMWFHSHSTCPVCRNPLISDQVEIIVEQEEAMSVMLEDDAENDHHHDSGSEQASSSSSSSSLQTDKNRERPDLVLDIPPREANEEDDEKTPGSFSRSMRSLKRILSGNSRLNPFSPRS